VETYAYGFPRLGEDREYKRIVEGYWNRDISELDLRRNLDDLERKILSTYARFVSNFPVGEMTLYDAMLDTAIMVGLYKAKDPNEYFNLCRGKNALRMKKWFNTNYHYLVPNFSVIEDPSFTLGWNKPKEHMEKHKKGIPYLLGPFTFLKLSEGIPNKMFSHYLIRLGEIYREMIKDFGEVHIEEPAFVMELNRAEIDAIIGVYNLMQVNGTDINLFTYYEGIDFIKDLYELPVKSLGLDFVHGVENYENIKKYGFPDDKILVAGLIDGLNIWRSDIDQVVKRLKWLSLYAKNLMVSNAGPLYHLPITTEGENLDQRLLECLAFAKEKLYELKLVSLSYEEGLTDSWYKPCKFEEDTKVKKRMESLDRKDFIKPVSYEKRRKIQEKILNLPLFPTTTIGSFPQTSDLREKRKDFRAGRVSENEYRTFIKKKISEVIALQEELGLDVLVHGEFERSDMVEFFAEKLDGIATTQKGWIISYGTRVYRPPIIYGDISRPQPMTTNEIGFAQSLTQKPVKGILTGPVTIVAWSFIRLDIPVSEIALQIALCIQDEIKDYEKQGIKIVQIDEPAFKELAPIKKRNWNKYFDWAVAAFNLASQSEPETQVHTHMCYSEFGDIIEFIEKMDFDVISIEASRSGGDIIKSFEQTDFNRQIGLGIWDIHSPRIPSQEEMYLILKRALKVIPKTNLWINPDCGLKTRGWSEVKGSLKNMVELAHRLRGGKDESEN